MQERRVLCLNAIASCTVDDSLGLWLGLNRYYPTQKQFAHAILRFFREIIPREWKKFRDTVSDNFRIITHQNVRVLA